MVPQVWGIGHGAETGFAGPRRKRTEDREQKVRWWERLLAAIIKQEDSRVGHRAGLDQAATASCSTPKTVIRSNN
jgi:hypothetical protein